MKKKDIVFLVLAAGIFVVAGYVAFTQLAPKSSTQSKGVEVEVIGSIPSSFDGTAKTTLQDRSQVSDFNSPVDLTGLGNNAPFGQ